MHESDREKSAFVAPHAQFEFLVMPFGLTGPPSTFQRLMTAVLSGLQYEVCLVYLDDVVIFSQTFDEHIERPRKVFQRFREANLKIRPSKCHFLKKSVTLLGHVVSDKGVATDPAKISAVKEWATPKCVNEVQEFLGLATYYRRFVKGFAEIA